MNWFEPMAKEVTQHLLAGLLLSVGIIVPFLVVSPLLINARRGRAATSQRILSLLFLVLAIAPISSSLQLFRSRSENLKSHRSDVAEALSPSRPISSMPILKSRCRVHPNTRVHCVASDRVGQLADSVSCHLDDFSFPSSDPAALGGQSALDPSSKVAHCPMATENGVPPQNCFSRVDSYPGPDGNWIMGSQGVDPFDPGRRNSRRMTGTISCVHEIAHLERYDDWSNFIQRLFLACNPFNPFLWFVGRDLQSFSRTCLRRLGGGGNRASKDLRAVIGAPGSPRSSVT